jgi:hypothetical protein
VCIRRTCPTADMRPNPSREKRPYLPEHIAAPDICK